MKKGEGVVGGQKAEDGRGKHIKYPTLNAFAPPCPIAKMGFDAKIFG